MDKSQQANPPQTPNDFNALAKALGEHPALAEHVRSLLAIARNEVPGIVKADDAEDFITRESRALNQAAINSWAAQAAQSGAEKRPKETVSKKKESTGSPRTGESKPSKRSSSTPKAKR